MKNLIFKTNVALALILSLLSLCAPSFAKDKQPNFKKYDSCDGINGNPPRQLDFPNVKTALAFFPNLLDTKSTKPPFIGEGSFNFACGGTALSGEIKIKPNNGKPSVYARTCGDLAMQTEEEACSDVYNGRYKPIMKTGSDEKMILKYNRIFLINEDGTVSVSSVYHY